MNAVSPSSHYIHYADLAYGGHERQKLDVYVPRNIKADPPVVVFFYGGGWNSGARQQYEFVAASLTANGMVVVIPDYRLFPEVRFPEFLNDGAEAVSWVARNIPDYGGKPDRIHLMGHSAGAHIAAMLALDNTYLERSGAKDVRIEKLIGLSGPYDFLPLKLAYLKEVFPEDRRAQSQPINFVGSGAPPTLLIHGSDDDVVAPFNSEHLASALENSGVPVILKLYKGFGHERVAVALAPRLGFIGHTMEDTVDFIMHGVGGSELPRDLIQAGTKHSQFATP